MEGPEGDQVPSSTAVEVGAASGDHLVERPVDAKPAQADVAAPVEGSGPQDSDCIGEGGQASVTVKSPRTTCDPVHRSGTANSPSTPSALTRTGATGQGGRGDGGQPFEDCYPPRREDEVRTMRRQREKYYQLELLRQIEAKRVQKKLRRQEEVVADLQQLGRSARHDEYLNRLQHEQQQHLRAQLQAQLRREEQREEQRMAQVTLTREQQREQFREQQPDLPGRQDQGLVDKLSVSLERQHIPDDAPEPSPKPGSAAGRPEHEKPVEPGDAKAPPPEAVEGTSSRADDLAAGVSEQVKLEDSRPWNHYRLLQKELGRRRRERAAREAREAARDAAREAANAEARMDSEHRRYLDWRARVRRPGAVLPPSPRMEAARRWAQGKRQAVLQQRVHKDSHLAEWRRAKDEQERARRAAAVATEESAKRSALDRQRLASDSFTRWLATIHDRKLAERAGPVGATGPTTYESFYAAPWNKILRGRRKSTA